MQKFSYILFNQNRHCVSPILDTLVSLQEVRHLPIDGKSSLLLTGEGVFEQKMKTPNYGYFHYVMPCGSIIEIDKDISVVFTPANLWTVKESSYDIPQNGTFCSETIYFKGKPIFYWSDNNGLNGKLEENDFQAMPDWVIEKYKSFQERSKRYAQYCEEMYDEDGFNNLTAQGF